MYLRETNQFYSVFTNSYKFKWSSNHVSHIVQINIMKVSRFIYVNTDSYGLILLDPTFLKKKIVLAKQFNNTL